MPENIGPKIGIDGYADFTRSMRNIISQSKELASEMKLVTSEFDKNDTSQDKLAAQMQVLNKQIDVQAKRVNLLGDRYQESEKKVSELRTQLQKTVQEYGNTSKEAQKVQQALDRQETATSNAKTEYNNARTALNKMNGELADLRKQADGAADSVDDVADSIGDAAGEAKGADFGDILGAGTIIEGTKSIIESIGSVIDETSEYRRIMASLDTSSAQAGYTADETSEAYRRLYGALGDEQSGATALANLQALNLNQDELMGMLGLVTGAWARYGDSIPIDSLSESINETIRTGTVTGTFADVLNWGAREGETFGVMLKDNTEANQEWNDAVNDAVTAEDFFNLALQDAGSQTERANLLMQAMADQGLAATADAWYQNNQDIVAANDAQLTFTENAAQLAERVAPAVNAVKAGFNDLFAAALQATEGIDFQAVGDTISAAFQFLIDNSETIVGDLAIIGAGIAALKLAQFGASIASILTGATTLTSVFPALGGAVTLLTGPFGLVIAAITGVVLAVYTFRDQITSALQSVNDFLTTIFALNFTEIFGPVLGEVLNGFMLNTQNLWMSFYTILTGIITFITGVFSGNWKMAWEGIKQTFAGIFKGLVSIAKAPLNAIIGLINGAINALNMMIDGLNSIQFDVPDWVPVLGGQHFGLNIPNIPNVPYLAKGGTVLSGSAIVGEAGPELLTVTGNRTIVRPLTSGESLTRVADYRGGITVVLESVVFQNYTPQQGDALVNDLNRALGRLYT